MKALLNYHFKNYLRVYKYIPPLTVFIIMLIVNYTFIPNPILDSYSFTSLVLFFLMGWVTISIMHTEDEEQKQITLLHAKNPGLYYLSLVIICVMVGLLFSVVSVLYPILINAFRPGLQIIHILAGIFSHFSLALLSIGLSLFFTREFVKNSINTWWGVICVLVITLVLAIAKIDILDNQLFHWTLPPLRTALELMSMRDEEFSFSIYTYGQFGWVFLYSLLLIVFFIAIATKRRKA